MWHSPVFQSASFTVSIYILKNGDKRGVVNADKCGVVPLLLSFTNICKDTNAYKGWQLISDLNSKKWLQKGDE